MIMKSKYILIWIGGAVLAGGFTGLLGARLYLKYNSQPIILDMLKGYFSSNKFI
jgi:hypothetical protein